MSDDKNSLLSFLQLVSTVFVAISAVAYVTGFLIVSTFLGDYGLREVGTELFKSEYIYVGCLFMLFPISILFPVLLVEYMVPLSKRSERRRARRERRPVASRLQRFQPLRIGAYLLVNMLLVCYLIATFAPHRFFASKEDTRAFAYVVLFTIAGMVLSHFVRPAIRAFSIWTSDNRSGPLAQLLRAVCRMRPNRERNDTRVSAGRLRLAGFLRSSRCLQKALTGRWYYFIVRFVIIGLIARPELTLIRHLWSVMHDAVFAGGAYLFYLLMVVILLLAFGALRRYQQWKARPEPIARPYYAFIALLIAALYYVSIINYGHRLYPYIPAFKGGGDYTDMAPVRFHLTAGALDSVPPELSDTTKLLCTTNHPRTNDVVGVTYPLIILEKAGESVFVALTNSANGPKAWRRRGGAKPWVYEIRWDAVGPMIVENDTNTLASVDTNGVSKVLPATPPAAP